MGSRSKGPDANSDAEGNLTPAGVAANKKQKQLDKAQNAAANSLGGVNGTGLQAGDAYAGLSANLNAAGSNQNFNQQLGQNYLDSYNDLKGQKKKTKNQLSNLAAMNEQMGYNPTQGMGIMGSLNYNTIGAGDDIANLMNNPLVKMAGMATNPALFAGGQFLKNAYGAYSDENDDTGLLSALGNTAQDVTPFDTNRITDFLGNIFRQEEEEADYVGSEVINTAPIEPVETGPLDGKTSSNTYQPIQGMVLDKILGFIEPVTDFYNQATTPLTDIELNSNPVLNSKITPDNIDQYQNNVEQEKLGVDMFQTGEEGSPYQQFFNDSYSKPGGLLFPDRRAFETNDNNFIDPNINSNMPIIGGTNNYDPGVLEASTGYGTINPGANYNKLYGFTAANGGRVPPMSGPMSNGLGNLFKMK